MADLVSGVLLSVESLQEHYLNTNIVESHFNLIQDAVIILTLGQTIQKVNRSALSMLGLRTQDQVLGKHVTEVITSANNHLFAVFKELVESKSP